MAAKLAVTTALPVPHGVDAGGESFVILGPDDEVPDWALEQLDDHCFEGGKKPAKRVTTQKSE